MKQVIHSPKALGQFINRVRKKKNLTQAQAGEAFKINQTTISSVEQGAKGTQIETVFRILMALDLELVLQEKKRSSSNKEVEW